MYQNEVSWNKLSPWASGRVSFLSPQKGMVLNTAQWRYKNSLFIFKTEFQREEEVQRHKHREGGRERETERERARAQSSIC